MILLRCLKIDSLPVDELLQKVEAMLGEMPSYPEEAVEMLDDVDSPEAEELSIAIQTLIDETDEAEAEAYYNEQEDDEAFESKKFNDFLIENKKGSSEPNRSKVGTISWDKIRLIAEDKLPDMNCFTVDSAMLMIAGTARSMGVIVKGGDSPTK